MDTKLMFAFLSWTVRAWSRTLRYKRLGFAPVQEARAQGPVIFALWHDELFAPCYLHRDEQIVAVVSASRDGEILAQVMARLGFQLARGSSSRNGMQAVRRVLQLIERSRSDAVLTVDGPKGPRHEVKEGAVYIAAKSGLPVVPVRVHAHPVKRFSKAWDKFQLPLPGARCVVHYGRPYTLSSKKINSLFLHQERERLQAALHALTLEYQSRRAEE
ncbi:lysophospholipid acyltransferase family protein [Desulfovermiculus halophilus]|uniref:lysophospholipid acyltransferase family protein n=1 Tax=Desulfovermiculus halophilus TaxID=339722 RepID=UPI001FC9C1D0|nr:lysophospholipid acyltransferase family protein [Desulfovermiculus halophilus]